MQMIFQDPFSSLNPRMTVRDIVGEPLRCMGMPANPPPTVSACDRSCPVGLLPYMRSAIRTSSPAGSVSASASPAPWR